MLDPKALASLSDALEQVITQIGDDPKLQSLVEALSSARDAAVSSDEGEAPDEEADPDADPNAPKRDPFSFDDAQAQLTENRSGVA